VADRCHGRFRRIDAHFVLARPGFSRGAGRPRAGAALSAASVGFLAAACGGAGHPLATPSLVPDSSGTSSAAAPGNPSHAVPSSVDRQISAMPLEREVGQVFMSYAYGRTATDAQPDMVHANQLLSGVDTAAQLVSRWHVGGLLLLDHNPLDVRQPTLSTNNLASSRAAPCRGLVPRRSGKGRRRRDDSHQTALAPQGDAGQRCGRAMRARPDRRNEDA